MTDKKNSKMGAGLVIGMLLGAVGGMLFAPKSGKENREEVAKRMKEMKGMIESGEMQAKVQEVFGDLSKESVKMYKNTRQEILQGIEELRTMDKDDYGKMVQDVIDRVKEGSKMTSEKVTKLKNQFMKEYPEMKEKQEKKTKQSTDKKLIANKKK